MPGINLIIWKNLYQAAVEFKKLAPWKWFTEKHIFGVQNPLDHQIGFCSILGNKGEHFALAVYPGAEGLKSFLDLSQNRGSYFRDLYYSQKCLIASFENSKLITAPDKEIINSLGLTFRGRNAWPLFRNYLPGYYPWYLENESQAQFLTVCLTQAAKIAVHHINGVDAILSAFDDEYFVKVPVKNETNLNWIDRWISMPQSGELPVPEIKLDFDRLSLFKHSVHHTDEKWILDYFFSPIPVKDDDERPYFTKIFILANAHNSMLIDSFTFKDDEYFSILPKQILELIEKRTRIPEEIQSVKPEIFQLLKPLTEYLGIRQAALESSPLMDSIHERIFQSLENLK